MLPRCTPSVVALLVSLSAAGAASAQVTVEGLNLSGRPALVQFKVDALGRDVTAVKSAVYLDDREVSRGGAAVPVRFDAPAPPAPVSVTFVLDVSRSMSGERWRAAVNAVAEIAGRLPAGSLVTLVTAGDDVRDVVSGASDLGAVPVALSKLAPTDGQTRLHDALFDVLGRQPALVVVVTDGLDSGSSVLAGDVVARASRSVPVMAVHVGDEGTSGGRFLRRLAAASGGRYAGGRSPVPDPFVTTPATRANAFGTISFDADGLAASGMHRLRVTLADARTGRALGEATAVVVAGAPSAWSPPASWTTAVLALLALGLGVALIVATRREQAPALAAPVATASSEPVSEPVQMRRVRERLKALADEAAVAEQAFVDYGNPLEQKVQAWRAACQETARRAVAPMRSCWLMREAHPSFEIIYNEMLASLSVVGVRQLAPQPGEAVNPDDVHFVLAAKRGEPPYTVVRTLTPGFFFSPRTRGPKEPADEVLLNPAELEVEGAGASAASAGK
jgi:hypothetical protein